MTISDAAKTLIERARSRGLRPMRFSFKSETYYPAQPGASLYGYPLVVNPKQKDDLELLSVSEGDSVSDGARWPCEPEPDDDVYHHVDVQSMVESLKPFAEPAPPPVDDPLARAIAAVNAMGFEVKVVPSGTDRLLQFTGIDERSNRTASWRILAAVRDSGLRVTGARRSSTIYELVVE